MREHLSVKQKGRGVTLGIHPVHGVEEVKEWVSRYEEVVSADVTVSEADPVSVLVVEDGGSVAVATSGPRSVMLAVAGEYVRTRAAEDDPVLATAADRSGIDLGEADNEALVALWGSLGVVGHAVRLTQVVEPMATLRVRRFAGWRIRCWGQSQTVEISAERMAEVMGVPAEYVERMEPGAIEQALLARSGTPAVRDLILSALTPRFAVVAAVGAGEG